MVLVTIISRDDVKVKNVQWQYHVKKLEQNIEDYKINKLKNKDSAYKIRK